jgi:hypothetical protein
VDTTNTDDQQAEVDLAELERADITRRVSEAMDEWRWNRDAAVKDFPPAVREFLLKDWEPGKL